MPFAHPFKNCILMGTLCFAHPTRYYRVLNGTTIVRNHALTKQGTNFQARLRAGVNIFQIKAETEGAVGVHTLGFETLDSQKAVYDRRTPAQKAGTNLRPGEVIRFSLGLPYIEIDGSRFPYAARHIRDVLRARRIFTIDRPGADRRRTLSRRNYLRVQNGTPNPNTRLYQYDEAPPAVFLENAGRGHVRVIPQRDNGGAGGSLNQQLNNYGSGNKKLDDGWKVQFWATAPTVSTPSIVPDVPILWN